MNLVAREAQMVETSLLTERQLRERQYYDEFVRRRRHVVPSLGEVDGKKHRPWNPYWYLEWVVSRHFTGPTQRLLDFGCGPGRYAVAFARLGYEVSGFDISKANIEVAEMLARQHAVAHRTHFSVGTAERLDYPSSYFDIIVGLDILHHVEIRTAMEECLRVLKPDGIAVFKEPNDVPISTQFETHVWLGPSSRRTFRSNGTSRRTSASSQQPICSCCTACGRLKSDGFDSFHASRLLRRGR